MAEELLERPVDLCELRATLPLHNILPDAARVCRGRQLKVVAFDRKHIEKVYIQEMQGWVREYFTEDMIRALETSRYCYTAVDGDKVIAIAGVIPFTSLRGYAWAILASDISDYFRRLHVTVKYFLNWLPFERIESAVDVDHVEGHRWMRLLGFKKETQALPGYIPGRLAVQYGYYKGVN